MANPLLAPLLGFLGRLSYPRLFMITAALFVIDLIVPGLHPVGGRNPAGPGQSAAGELQEPQDADRRANVIEGDSRR